MSVRYVIAKDRNKWRVYDDHRKEFAEHFTQASDKANARKRAAKMNANDTRKENPVKNYRVGKSAKELLSFLQRNYGWQSLGGSGHPNSPVKKAARSLENAGLIEIARHSGEYGRDWQARLINVNPLREQKSARNMRKKVRAKTCVVVRYKITAQNKGKRMHFDGRNFSERPTVKSFALASDAKQTALALIRRYPILRKYRVRVESFP